MTVVPNRIRVPSIKLDDDQFMQLDLNADHSLAVPPLTEPYLVGWYKRSPVPGDGPTGIAETPVASILAGHINADGKQGAFANLAKVKVGDEVDVSRSDGRTAVFKTTRVQIVDKDAFPTQSVYEQASGVELRMITCGPFDLDKSAHRYRDQTILYASLVTLKPTGG